MIQPGEGGNPFDVAVKWFGRPLGSDYASPNSPKDIDQYHFSQTIKTSIGKDIGLEVSYTLSEHSNKHLRPDIIDSRFLDSINGTDMGISGGEIVFWNLFDSSQNSEALINYVKGSEKSVKKANLESLDLILRSNDFVYFLISLNILVPKPSSLYFGDTNSS